METMPDREIRTYDIRARRVTPASDVTAWAKVRNNTGTAMAAGVVSGAWQGRPSVSKAVVGECGLSRSGHSGQREGCKAVVISSARFLTAEAAAKASAIRSDCGMPLLAVWESNPGGAGRTCSDERADG